MLNSLPKITWRWFATWKTVHEECLDGASSAIGAGARIIIITLKGIRLEHSFRLGFKASNNEVEDEALIARLKTAFDLGARDVEVYLDSRLVVNQV